MRPRNRDPARSPAGTLLRGIGLGRRVSADEPAPAQPGEIRLDISGRRDGCVRSPHARNAVMERGRDLLAMPSCMANRSSIGRSYRVDQSSVAARASTSRAVTRNILLLRWTVPSTRNPACRRRPMSAGSDETSSARNGRVSRDDREAFNAGQPVQDDVRHAQCDSRVCGIAAQVLKRQHGDRTQGRILGVRRRQYWCVAALQSPNPERSEQRQGNG